METPDGRLIAFGNQLIDVHLWLREELDELRENLDAFIDGTGIRPRELQAHCLAFCTALSRHHTDEDADAFPRIAAELPALRPVLEELSRDHHIVEESLQRLEKIVDAVHQGMDPATARAELDTLAALMETHFVYEEKRIVDALNTLKIPTWNQTQPDFLRTDP